MISGRENPCPSEIQGLKFTNGLHGTIEGVTMATVSSPTNFARGKVKRREGREERVRGETVEVMVGEVVRGEEAWGWRH